MENIGRNRRYEFSGFTLDANRGSLERDGNEVPLRPKAFAVLQHLVKNQGKLVSRDELIEAVWGHPHVSDSSLSQCLRDIRQALDDHEQLLIQTVPRRGYRFEPLEENTDSASPESPAVEPAGIFRRGIVIVFAVFVLLALFVFTMRDEPDPGENARAEATNPFPKSIAVLPFLDLSPELDLGYLADGLAEEILNSLAQSSDLRVVSRTSSFAFRGENVDLESIAEILDVDLVLEGSVRRENNQVRVTTQLIDTRSQAHLWSKTYDYALEDLFDLQTEVASDVFLTTRSKSDTDLNRGNIKPGSEAYNAYLIGVHFLNRGESEALQQASENLQRATRLSPRFAPAWSKLSDCYRRLAYRSPESSETLFAAYLEAAELALALDPGLPEARYLKALKFRFQGHHEEFMEVISEGLAAGSEDPNFLMLAMGDAFDYKQYEAAARLAEEALKYDPLSAIARINFGYLLIEMQRFEDALAQFEQLRMIHAGGESWKAGRATVLLLLGRLNEAEELALTITDDDDFRNTMLAMARWDKNEVAQARAFIQAANPDDELQQLASLVEWYSFTGQFDEAFDVMQIIREQHSVECSGPNSVLCGQLSGLWGSPFLETIRNTKSGHEWIDAFFPGHSARTEQREALYAPYSN